MVGTETLSRLQAQEHDPGRVVVLTGGHVVTMAGPEPEPGADVLLTGDTVTAVGPGLAAQAGPGAVVVDVSGSVVLPGFVDSHVHAWEGALRGIAPDADFGTYMAIAHGGIGPLMTPEDIAVGQRITAAQALNGGVTTFIDNCHNSRTPEHSDAAIEALRGSGIRAVHAAGHPSAGHLPQDLLRLRDQYFSSTDQLLTLRMFDMSPTPASWQFAADHGLGMVAEVGFWLPELDALLGSGLMGPAHTYNHCAGLTPAQWDAVAASGAAVNVVPRSDSHYGLGAFVPILEADRRGLQVGLSCDNELDYGYDIFTEMRVLLTVQRGLAIAAGETPYGARDVLRAATVGGALNAGLSDKVGTLAPGRKADLVILDLNQIPTRPYGSVLGTVVNFAGIANVDAVFVDGKVRKWAGRLVGTDYDALAAAAEESRDRLLREYGTSPAAVRAGTNLEVKA
jgi:cytosine/adenosine deaminase-related metal-dependent hydrolase